MTATATPGLALARGPVVVDIAGTTLAEPERARLLHPLVGGVILFARNFASKPQLRRLCDAIHALRSPPLLIAVDHEGGRVQRFREGFTAIGAMRQLGALWDQDPLAACARAAEVGRVIGGELLACGVDLSFTPVLDLDHQRSEVIGDRALHAHPHAVTMLARALLGGLLDAGMAHCAKHFPGHGWAQADSHHELPVDEREEVQILTHDALPYQSLGPMLRAVMPAHLVYPQVDALPAGFSRRWITGILRERLGFEGLVFSDDLTMEGASGAGSILARAGAALAAGCDMVLVCNRPERADEVLAGLAWNSTPRFQQRLQALMPRR